MTSETTDHTMAPVPVYGGCPSCGVADLVLVGMIHTKAWKVPEPWGHSVEPAIQTGWIAECGCRLARGHLYFEADVPYARWLRDVRLPLPVSAGRRFTPEAFDHQVGTVIRLGLPGFQFPVKVISVQLADEGRVLALTVVDQPPLSTQERHQDAP